MCHHAWSMGSLPDGRSGKVGCGCSSYAAATMIPLWRLRSQSVQRHSEHILDMLRAGISMRTIRRHRLDDPRLTDAVRAVLVEAARERQSKARFRRSEEQRKEDQLRTLITLCPAVSSTRTDGPKNDVPQARSPAENVVTEPLALPAAIQLIRHQV